MSAAQVVHKFEIPFGESALDLPVGARFLHVATQPKDPQGNEGVFLWALVDPEAVTVRTKMGYFATGEPLPENVEHVGTTITADGAFVWHVFQEVLF